MVCLGNICRSPMAEGIFRKKAEEKGIDITIDSAGTADYHVGEHPDPRAVRNAARHGVDISHLTGRQFSKDDFDRFDLILTMDSSNYDNVLRLAGNDRDREKVKMVLDYLYPGQGMEVPDPWYGGDAGFEHVFRLLDKAAERFYKENFNK